MSHSERKEAGLEGYKWATGDEAGFTSSKMAKKVENNIDKLFATWTPRKNYELINTNQVKEDVLPHKLLY